MAEELSKLEQQTRRLGNATSSSSPCSTSDSVSSSSGIPCLPSHLLAASPNTITLHSATSVATIHTTLGPMDSLGGVDNLHLPDTLDTIHSIPSSPSFATLLPDTSNFKELNPMSSAHLMENSAAVPYSPSPRSSLSSSQSSLTSLSSHTGAGDSINCSNSLLASMTTPLPTTRPYDRLCSSATPRATSAHSLSLDYAGAPPDAASTPAALSDVFLRPSPRK